MSKLVAALVFCASVAHAQVWSIGASAGAVVESDGWSTAPALAVTGARDIGRRTFLAGSVTGFTLQSSALRGSSTEVLLAFGPGLRMPMTNHLAFTIAGAPVLALTDEATSTMNLGVGLGVSPALELATRRRTLALRVGAQGAWLTTGARLGAGAGLVYAFK